MTTYISDPTPAKSAAIASVVDQLQAEARWLTLMRLTFGVVCLSWLLLLLWAFPWAPLGAVADYSAAMVLGLLLALAAASSTVAFWFVWRPMFRREPLAEFVRVLFGAQRLIRQPGQFRSRLTLECRRAKRDRSQAFSLVVIQLATELTDRRGTAGRRSDGFSLASLLVRSIARADDVVAEARPKEIWMLAAGADDEGRQVIVRRMSQTLTNPAASLPAFADARIGSSTFGPNCTRPRDVFAAAYASATQLTAPAALGDAA